jgi:DUF4097 and DUF4098 domain-containing protein YvlB
MMTTLTLIACATAFGYLYAGPSEEYREEFSYNRETGSANGLVLKNINGPVTVTGVDGLTSVEIKGVKSVRDRSMDEAKSHIGDISIDMATTSEGLVVKTVQPKIANNRQYMVTYQIRVPSSWKVTVDNVNGDVKIASVENGVSVDLVNGKLETSNIAGNLDATIVNGQITSDAVLPEHGTCKLETTNGKIDAKLTMPSSAKCSLETTNGGITLSVPKSASANVTAETSIGKVAVDGLTFTTSQRSRDIGPGTTFTGVLGSGTGTITLAATNGQIALKGF